MPATPRQKLPRPAAVASNRRSSAATKAGNLPPARLALGLLAGSADRSVVDPTVDEELRAVVFDPIAPATSIGRNAPPAIAFGTSAENDEMFDHLLRDSAAEEPAAPARERPRSERRGGAAPAERSEPAQAEPTAEKAPAETTQKAEATETTSADTPEAKTETAPTATESQGEAERSETHVATAPAAETRATAATPAAAAVAQPVIAPDLAKLLGARPAATAAPSATNGELPTLQQLLASNGTNHGNGKGFGQTGDGHPQADKPLPEALARLLQPATASANGTSAAASSTGQGSFQAALTGTVSGSPVKPDVATTSALAANPAVLPTAAAAPVNPANTIAPLPALDPTQPLTASGLAGHTDDAGGPLKQVANLGATPARAAVPTTTPSLQLAVHIARAAQDGMNKVSVRLDPPELGRVDVKLEVGHDGRVQALVAADRQETLNMLQRDARDLARALTDAGLQADTGNLNFSLRQNGGDGPTADGDGRGQAPAGDLRADEPLAGDMAEVEPAAIRPTVASSHALDISV
jgi:flagellar hook-length control protein FliK